MRTWCTINLTDRAFPTSRASVIVCNKTRLQYDESECWKTSLVSSNFSVEQGWWNSRILKASEYSVGKLTASLTHQGWHLKTKGGDTGGSGEVVLKVVQQIMLCEQVKFNMNKLAVSQSIYLPWAPAVNQELELKAIGGLLHDHCVCISFQGLPKCLEKLQLELYLHLTHATMTRQVAVEVSIPSSMMMLHSFPEETVIGSQQKAAVTMKESDVDSWKQVFSHCQCDKGDSYPGQKVDNVELNESLFGPMCGWTHV
ncbi:hypothetical protein RJ641_023013 [Dillenia turbinata]|uniref:Uncharacterized protein n=1 Tax=Dillenia turbinata TaxID=194707 RepID=A0AAN8YUR1_9MAGN